MFLRKHRSTAAAAFVAAAVMCFATASQAQQAKEQAKEIEIVHKDKKFSPAEVTAPVDTPIVFKVKNQDGKAIEFESKTLKVEKVIAANGEATINVRPQKAGRYEFFDEFNEKNARGALVVK